MRGGHRDPLNGKTAVAGKDSLDVGEQVGGGGGAEDSWISGLVDWWINGLLESESSGIWLGSGSRIWVSVFMRVKMGVGFSRIYSDIVG